MQGLLQSIIDIVSGTPPHIWTILVLLLYLGVMAMRKRIVALPKLFIVPAILMVVNYKDIFLDTNTLYYLLFMFIGLVIGGTLGHKAPIRVIEYTNSIELPGTNSTLIILLSFFCIKYFLGYMEAIHSDLAQQQYLFLDVCCTSLFLGCFLGKAFCFVYRFYSESKAVRNNKELYIKSGF